MMSRKSVQSYTPPLPANRQHPTRRAGSLLLCPHCNSEAGSLIMISQPPANPGRFILLFSRKFRKRGLISKSITSCELKKGHKHVDEKYNFYSGGRVVFMWCANCLHRKCAYALSCLPNFKHYRRNLHEFPMRGLFIPRRS